MQQTADDPALLPSETGTDPSALLAALKGPSAVFDAQGQLRLGNLAFQTLEASIAPVWPQLMAGQAVEARNSDASQAWRLHLTPLADGGHLLTAQAAGSEGARKSYLSTLSHELRTPLSGVLGMASLLAETTLTKEQHAYVAALRESGQQLNSLVCDAIDLAKMEAGALRLDRTPVALEPLLQSVCEQLRPLAQAKGIEIAWAPSDAGQPVPAQIIADEARLRQILTKLAVNSIHATSHGGVLIVVQALPDPSARPGQHSLRFTVKDTGPSLTDAAQRRIFEPFTDARHGPGQKSAAAETGLELAVAKQLAEAHSGRLGLDSGPDQGAAFWFEAGFEIPPDDAGLGQASRPLAGQTVAVASPHTVTRQAACQQIMASGGQALAFETLEEAESSLPQDGILLVDNAYLGQGLAVHPLPGHPCLILLDPEERSAAGLYRLSGFNSHLVKPLRQSDLVAQIQAVQTSPGIAAAPLAALPRQTDRLSANILEGARILVVDDNPISALLARSLLTQEGCRVDCVSSADEVLSLKLAGIYDLILMDMRMPGMDGLTLTARLRALGVTTPILAQTAHADDESRKACLAAGMNDFLSKPMDRAILRLALTRWLGPDAAAQPVWTCGPAQAKLAG